MKDKLLIVLAVVGCIAVAVIAVALGKDDKVEPLKPMNISLTLPALDTGEKPVPEPTSPGFDEIPQVGTVENPAGEGTVAAPTGKAVDANLNIKLYKTGKGPATDEVTVQCPSKATACKRLSALTAKDLRPLDSTQTCIEIFGGNETAKVVGTFNDQRIKVTLKRTDGCAIEQYDLIVAALIDPKDR